MLAQATHLDGAAEYVRCGYRRGCSRACTAATFVHLCSDARRCRQQADASRWRKQLCVEKALLAYEKALDVALKKNVQDCDA